MNTAWKKALLDRLSQQQIVSESAATRMKQQTAAPWFVALLSGLAAWLAALLLIGGTLFSFIGDNTLAAAITGAVLLGLAVWLLRQTGVFVNQLGLALSLVGQGMLMLAVSQLDVWSAYSDRLPAIIAALVAMCMLLVPAVAMHRLACILIAIGAGVIFIGLNAWLTLYGLLLATLAAGFWLRRSYWAGSRQAGLWRALAGGATLAGLLLPIIGNQRRVESMAEMFGQAGPLLSWLYPTGASALLLCTAMYLLRKARPTVRLGAGIAAVVLVVLGAQTPGLLVAAALWLAVFHACERFWCVLVGVGTVLYLGDLYYSLHITLLHKSLVLMASGVVLLALRWFLLRQSGEAHAA